MKYLLFFVTFFAFTCGGSSDIDEPIIETPTSIILTVNKAAIDLGETVIFSVKDNLNNTVTSEATIYFDDVAISGFSYTPSIDGNFAVRAEYGGLVSSSINVEVSRSIVLTIDKSKILLGGSVTLTVADNEGTNLTNDALYFVNGNEISGNTYTPSKRGNETITATYSGINSNEVNLLTGYKQKVLIEDFTGTWCGWCPRVLRAIELVEAQTDESITVAIHRGSTNSSSDSYDPFNYSAGALEDYIGLNGYPTAMINRKILWNYPETSYIGQVTNLVENSGINRVKNVGVKIASTLTNNTLDITVNSDVINDFDGEKLVVYILENGLNYNQTNYTTYFGGQSVLSNFEHNNVLRQVPTNIFGDVFTVNELNSETGVYKKEFTIELTGNIQNTSNLDIVAFVVDASGKVLNSQRSEVGVTKDFE